MLSRGHPRGLTALVAALAIAGAPPPPAPPTDAYQRALELYRAGRFAEANVILEPEHAARPKDAGVASLLGWSRFRLGRIPDARRAFEAAVHAQPQAADALAGLGYVSLREKEPEQALDWFRRATERDPASVDAWKGLGMARRQTGDRKGAHEAYLRARALAPADAEIRDLIAENLPPGDPLEERRRRARPEAASPPRVLTRAGPGRLEVRDGESFRPLFLKGINLGTALPGRFPAEFPDDPALYRRWFDLMGEAGFNAVRLYTLHPPSLYRALREHNAAHPERRLMLIQGVWSELAPRDDYDAPAFLEPLAAEIRRVIDAVHGNLELPSRPGHAHGVYDADLSDDALAFLLGREWEPYSVVAYEKLRPGRDRHDGRYVSAAGVRPFEAWLASILDLAAAHETEEYGVQHALGLVSWPTLDPLHHPTEATSAEETRIRLRRGEILAEPIREYDNDLVDLDTLHLTPTAAFPAGIYACYHVYPYYPDFMILDPEYNRASDSRGRNNYVGYLRALKAHHGNQPVLVGEFGVPTSRGIAHLQPQGMHHGGHTEREQGEIDLRLFRNLREAGLAGGILFSWMDEWFKRNWLVMNFEVPPERNPLWQNALDPEQNYGLLAASPGSPGPAILVDGRRDDWAAVPALLEAPARGPALEAGAPPRPCALRVASDEAYVYLLLELEGDGKPLDWQRLRYWIGIDTYDIHRGSHRFPAPIAEESAIGMEFLVELAGDSTRLLVDEPYDLFTNRLRRPYRSLENHDGRFVRIEVFTNRDRFGRDGTYYPARGYDRSPLRRGSSDPSSPAYGSLAEWMDSADGSFVEARIPWGLLNVTDPSSRQVVHETRNTTDLVETAASDGLRFHVLGLERLADGRLALSSSLPRGPAPAAGDFPAYLWPGWEQPRYHLRLKQSYEILKNSLPDL